MNDCIWCILHQCEGNNCRCSKYLSKYSAEGSKILSGERKKWIKIQKVSRRKYNNGWTYAEAHKYFRIFNRKSVEKMKFKDWLNEIRFKKEK